MNLVSIQYSGDRMWMLFFRFHLIFPIPASEFVFPGWTINFYLSKITIDLNTITFYWLADIRLSRLMELLYTAPDTSTPFSIAIFQIIKHFEFEVLNFFLSLVWRQTSCVSIKSPELFYVCRFDRLAFIIFIFKIDSTSILSIVQGRAVSSRPIPAAR